jgi:trans-2,3-dihydro-3-hydroxyanthranilate isomerase
VSTTTTESPEQLPHVTPLVPQHRKISIRQVDAFTEIPMTGNPAGVVSDASGLSDRQMQTIAREMFVSETAFILPATSPEADLMIRWFTPTAEVPLCGHATIASFHVLAEEGLHGMDTCGTYIFKLETKSGILPVRVEKSSEGINVFLGLRLPDFVRGGQYKLDIMRILNISLDEFENRLPIVIAKYIYVPVRRLHTIFGMKPNFFAMSQFLMNRNLTGMCVFTTETVDRNSAVHSRFFAPSLGINEDPVTGSAQGPIGVYLVEHGMVKLNGDPTTLIAEQGDVINRKGRVIIQLEGHGKKVQSVTIGGRAVTIIEGEMAVE